MRLNRMHFENHTPLPATLVRSAERDDRISCLVACAVTYAFRDGALALAAEQRPLQLEPAQSVPTDVVFVADRGVSVCVTGRVYPRGAFDRSAVTRLRVGDRELAIRASGKRIWQRSIGSNALVPSSPDVLEPVEMRWENAYGGKYRRRTSVLELSGEEVLVPAHEVGFPPNPDGVGFFLDPADAEGRPLPQLEWEDVPLKTFGEHPEPACFALYPLYGGLRGEFVVRGGTIDKGRLGRLTSRAVPRLTFDAVPPGTPVTLSGMRPNGEVLAFAIPESPAALSLDVGQEGASLPLALDAVDIDAERRAVRLVFRVMVSYALVRHERRVARLLPSRELARLPGPG